MPDAFCTTCPYFRPEWKKLTVSGRNSNGECFRHPPAYKDDPLPDGETGEYLGDYPYVSGQTWCGEHPDRRPALAGMPNPDPGTVPGPFTAMEMDHSRAVPSVREAELERTIDRFLRACGDGAALSASNVEVALDRIAAWRAAAEETAHG